MDKTLDARATSIFEIIGSYFVDVYFNHIYHNAKADTISRESLTDKYIDRVSAYSLSLKNEAACYATIAAELHKYFVLQSNNHVLFPEFIRIVVEATIPQRLIRNITDGDRMALFNIMISDLVSNLSVQIVRGSMLKKIVTYHGDDSAKTVRTLQDIAMSIMSMTRQKILSNFLADATQAAKVPAIDHAQASLLGNAQQQIQMLVRKFAKFRVEYEQIKEENDSLVDECDELREELKNLEKKYKSSQKKIAALEEEKYRDRVGKIGESAPRSRSPSPVARASRRPVRQAPQSPQSRSQSPQSRSQSPQSPQSRSPSPAPVQRAQQLVRQRPPPTYSPPQSPQHSPQLPPKSVGFSRQPLILNLTPQQPHSHPRIRELSPEQKLTDEQRRKNADIFMELSAP